MRADTANQSRYLLPDQPTLGTDVIAEPEASAAPSAPTSGSWQVALTLTDDGISAFNDVALAP
jgi:hypothetical protein